MLTPSKQMKASRGKGLALGHTEVCRALLSLLNSVLPPQTLLFSRAPGLAPSTVPGELQMQERRNAKS